MQTSCQTKLFSIYFECFDLFINQTQGKIHSQEADTKEFLCLRFFLPSKTYLFCDYGILVGKCVYFILLDLLTGK